MIVCDPSAIKQIFFVPGHHIRNRIGEEILVEVAGAEDVVVEKPVDEMREIGRGVCTKKAYHDDANRSRGSGGSRGGRAGGRGG